MENTYDININNKYSLFIDDEEGDPFDMVAPPKAAKVKASGAEEKENKTQEKQPKKSKSSKPGEKNSSKQGSKQPTQKGGEARVKLSDQEERNNRRNRPDFNNQRNENGRPFDGDRPPPRRFDRPPRRFENEDQGEIQNTDSQRFDGPPRRFQRDGADRREGFEGGRGRGRGFMAGRGRGGFRGGRREYDRHSGSERSGVRPTEKREGGGAYNWGNTKDAVQEIEETEGTGQQEKVEVVEDWGNSSGSGGEEPASPEAKEPEERPEMTLEEYKALKNAKHVKHSFNIRKAGEGEDHGQWKPTFVLKKKATEDAEEESSEDEVVETYMPKTKKIMDIDFQFSDTPLRGRGRGRGRGGIGRGMGGRGRGRGAYSKAKEQRAPKMDDEGDFPTLK